jgi:uncharacterized protein YcbK (DUF882 family)
VGRRGVTADGSSPFRSAISPPGGRAPLVRQLARALGPAGRRDLARAATFVVAVVAAAGFVAGHRPDRSLIAQPFAGPSAERAVLVPPVSAAPSAYGRSGAVHVRFALPNGAVDFPLAVQGEPEQLSYEWVRATDSLTAGAPRPLAGAALTAPAEPGFYRLALVRGAMRRIVEGVTLSVLVPFEAKRGTEIDGYRIGTFLAERRGREAERPDGFVRVTSEVADLPLTRHLRVADFLVRDGQQQWPRFAAIDPRVLDKVELVVAEVARMRGDTTSSVRVSVNVHSGFRSPWYNRLVPRAARDSRHQYGDAIDIAIDADGDGRLTARDARLVAAAAESVEREHPDLAGGVGVYTSRRYNEAYVHIDARGTRARWRG